MQWHHTAPLHHSVHEDRTHTHSHTRVTLAKERCAVGSLSCTGGWCMYVWIFNWTCVWLSISLDTNEAHCQTSGYWRDYCSVYLVSHIVVISVLFGKYQVFV